MSDEDWFSSSAAFFLSQAALRHMAERGERTHRQCVERDRRDGQHRPGQLRGVQVGPVGLLTKTWACANPRQGGQAASVSPWKHTLGFVATEMLEHAPPKVIEKIIGQIPVGRPRPEDARVVHFLAPTPPPTLPARSGASTAAYM